MNEKEFRSLVEPRLAKYFNVYPEQKENVPRNPRRIDAIIEYKPDPRFVFGIEYKTNEKKTGRDLAAFVNQAKGYAAVEWDFHTNAKKWGHIPVLICPPLSGNYLEYVDEKGFSHDATKHEHHNVNSFLAGLEGPAIGEVRYRVGENGDKILRFIFNNNTLWSEWDYDGVQINNIHVTTCERVIPGFIGHRSKLDSSGKWFGPNAQKP